MDLKDINRLIDKVTSKGITDFEMEHDGFKVRIRKDAPTTIIREDSVAAGPALRAGNDIAATAPAALAAAAAEAANAENDYHIITSPMVGTMYHAPAPGAEPFVRVGDRVRKGQVGCIVEAMKIMNEIQFDVDGILVKVHVDNEVPVEFGEPIFSVDVKN